MDLKLLTWFADGGAPFAMEVATRTAADKKGGHLARFKSGARDGRFSRLYVIRAASLRPPATYFAGARAGSLLLREAAQCLEEDEPAFQD